MRSLISLSLFFLLSCNSNSIIDHEKDSQTESTATSSEHQDSVKQMPRPYHRSYDSTRIDWKTPLEYREFSPYEKVTTYRFYGFCQDSIFKGMVSFVDSKAIDTLSHFTALKTSDLSKTTIPCIGSLETYHTKNNVDSYYVILFSDSTICKYWKEKIAKRATKYTIDSNGFFHEENLNPELFPCKADFNLFKELIPSE